MTPEARALFLKIARCQVMVDTLNGKETRCRKVVLCQTALEPPVPVAAWRRKHHLPDPWVGHIEQAPLLFLSSNPFVRRNYDASPAPPPQPPRAEFNGATIADHPSLGRPFEAPKAEWEDDQIVDKGEAMWDVWTNEAGTTPFLDAEKTLGAESPFWHAAHELASAFLDRAVRPGHDYALTEIVRCKSPKEAGVNKAAAECVPRYLDATLALSPAPVVAVLGRHARQLVRRMTGFADYGPLTPPHDIGGRDQVFAFLGHPGDWGRGAQVPQDTRPRVSVPHSPTALDVRAWPPLHLGSRGRRDHTHARRSVASRWVAVRAGVPFVVPQTPESCLANPT